MVDSNAKGGRRERELVTELDAAGFAVLRAPASGSATDRELPDVLAGNGRRVYAIEAKASAGDPIYADGDEVADLAHFAEKFGATPLLGVRFDRTDWRFVNPSNCHVTPGGNYRVKRGTAVAEGATVEGLVR